MAPALNMVKTIGTLLLFGLALVSAIQLHPVEFVSQKDYERLMEFRPLSFEFSQHFANISVENLDLHSSRLPSQQDLQCLTDITQLTAGPTSGKLWPLKMFDSWGSIPTGILYGNLIHMGNYDECIGIKKAISENYRVQGKYCLAKVPILPSVNFPPELKIGVCLPASCSDANMNTFLKQLFKKLLGININAQMVNEDTCRTSDRAPYDCLTIFTIVLLTVLSVALVVATLCDYFFYEHPKNMPTLVKAFSARANSRTLFRLTQPKSNLNVIDCLHGMRCLSLVWVLFGHQYIFAVLSPNINYVKLLPWMESPFTRFIFHGVFSVDTFFFLSGLLLVMIGMRSLEKTKGRLNIPLMYLHRYLRLTPLVAVAILMYWKLLPYFGDGPMFDSIKFDDYNHCKSNWIWTLLYVQNYATTETCINHSWYLAVDMQLYILSPIFLLALYKWGKKAAAGIFVLMLLLSACLFSTMMIKKYPITLEIGAVSEEAQQKLYFETHTHAAPWLIGALFGYFLHVNRSKTFQLNRIMVWMGWLVCLALIFTSIFVLYPFADLINPPLTMLDEAFYYTLTRIAWPLSLCWLVFACMNGYGGLANSFLSSPMWQPLSRLSYSAYIFHIFIQQINGRRIRSNTFFSDYDVMLTFWGTFGFTVLLSYVMFILMEAPFGVLEGMLMPKRSSKPKPVVPEEPQMEQSLDESQPAELQKSEDNTASSAE